MQLTPIRTVELNYRFGDLKTMKRSPLFGSFVAKRRRPKNALTRPSQLLKSTSVAATNSSSARSIEIIVSQRPGYLDSMSISRACA